MNRLVIIGNGFDMAHGLKTSYMDFINWYLGNRIASFVGNKTKVSQDCLCELAIKDKQEFDCWDEFAVKQLHINLDAKIDTGSGHIVFQQLKRYPDIFSVKCGNLFQLILQSFDTKGWVDIENDYYQLLKENISNPNCHFRVCELNKQLAFIQEELIKYLQTLGDAQYRNDIGGEIKDFFKLADFSTEGRDKALDNIGVTAKDFSGALHNYEIRNKLYPEQTMLLSFNYTNTVKMYTDTNIPYNYIHGELEKPQNVIFEST